MMASVLKNVDHAADMFSLQTTGFLFFRSLPPSVAALEERIELFSHLANLGATRSLTADPASAPCRQFDNARQEAGPKAVCPSIGIETADDWTRGLDQTLGARE